MKKMKFIGILIFIISVVAIIIGISIIFKTPKQKNMEVTPAPMGADSGLSREEFYNWETLLNIKFGEIVKETFNNDYPFDKDGQLTITLSDLEIKYQKDISEFNTETITCHKETSKAIVTKDSEGPLIRIKLECTNSEE